MKRQVFSSLVALCLSGATYRMNHGLQISHFQVENDFIVRPFRVVHLSDCHIPYSGFKLKRLLKEIRKLNPDLILNAGDILDRNIEDLDYASQFVKELKKIAPLISVWGNHEMGIKLDLSHIKEELNILENESKMIEVKTNKVQVIGLHPYQPKVVEVDDSCLTLVLDHYPHRQLIEGQSLFQFSGHVHGGQFRVKGKGLFGPDQGFFPKFTKGYYPRGNKSGLFVSAGLGATVIPLRLNNPNHLIVVDFS